MKNQRAFTLIELSIVLIIIGLLVAGIVGGQSLINQARLRSFVADANKYAVALHAFSLEYDALPGDMDNATAYWGSAAGCAYTNAEPTGSADGDGTCNGDGNADVSELNQELYMLWEHLTLSEIMPGEYSGISNGIGVLGLEEGYNCPATRLDTSACFMMFTDNANNNLPNGLYAVVYKIDGNAVGVNDLLTPRDMSSIDRKTDDGVPNKGFVSNRSFSGNCEVTVGLEQQYNLTHTLVACVPNYLITTN